MTIQGAQGIWHLCDARPELVALMLAEFSYFTKENMIKPLDKHCFLMDGKLT